MTFKPSTTNEPRKLTNTLLALVGVLAAVPAGAQTPTFRVTDLSAAPGSELCVATALNDGGQTAGSCGLTLDTNDGAAMWRESSMTRLGKLKDGNYAGATAINSLGIAVGDGDTGDWQPRPFLARGGKLFNVDPQGGANMHAIGLTDKGVIFGNYAKGLSGNTSAWTPVYYVEEPRKPGRFRRFELPRVPGGDSNANGAWANASNKAGQVVGDVQNSLFGQKGAFWNNDAAHSVVVLEPLPGGNQSIAWGINDLGQAVGSSHTPFVGSRAVMWDHDASHTPIDLGTLPGDSESVAVGANVAGQIVGSSWSAARAPRAFLYHQGVMLELATLVAPEDGTWTIVHVFAINNRGQILAAGQRDGRFASILLTPVVQ